MDRNDELLIGCIRNDERFDMFDHVELMLWGQAIGESPDICLELFDAFQHQKELFSNGKGKRISAFQLSKDGDLMSLSVEDERIFATHDLFHKFLGEDKRLSLSDELFFAFLGYVSDCHLPVHPLGSILQLDRKYFEKQFEGRIDFTSEFPEIKVVVTDRFLVHPYLSLYFPYGGVVYPIGAFEPGQRIQFGSQLVKGILFEGYTDEEEEAYVDAMKEEILLKQHLHSMSFATKEEKETLLNTLERKKQDG
jgi:hypothetical protein